MVLRVCVEQCSKLLYMLVFIFDIKILIFKVKYWPLLNEDLQAGKGGLVCIAEFSELL